jgi:hypothetical protein
MYKIYDDKSIHLTRGDAMAFDFMVSTGGANCIFRPGEVVRFKVFEKKSCHCVALQKDFPVTEAAEAVEIALTGKDTKIGDIISKPKDYWYEIELNPETDPCTVVGHDEDGAKVFRLYPEGGDLT